MWASRLFSLLSCRLQISHSTCEHLSSCEAEYMAATQLTKDVVFFRMFASELGFPQKVPTQLAIDNKAAIAMTQSRMMTCRTRHMRRREHYVREQAAEQEVLCGWVSRDLQVADIMTKYLVKDFFIRFRNMIIK